MGWKGEKRVAARKRPPYRSVVALAGSLGNAEHDQMNQQRQLIARQRPWKSVGAPPPPSGGEQQIYLYVLSTHPKGVGKRGSAS